MPSQSSPATPASQKSVQVSSSPTGTWRHPRYEEVLRRRNASRFTERHLHKILWNGGGILLTFILPPVLLLIPFFGRLVVDQIKHIPEVILIFRLSCFFNIAVALYPIFRSPDNMDDIPLTPTQRSLLGLDPNDTPPLAPGGHYITPPRYAKSTSRVTTPGSRQSSYNNSPAPGSQGSSQRGESPFSPLSPTPLFQKALTGGESDSVRRNSLGSRTPLSGSMLNGSLSFGALPSTPSPITGKGGTSLALNNRWLYQRGYAGPGSKYGTP